MYFFAFGTENDEGRLKERCPSAKLVHPAKIQCSKPEFFEYVAGQAVIDLIPDDRAEVWGGLYFIQDIEMDGLKGIGEPGKGLRFRPVWDDKNAAYNAYLFEGAAASAPVQPTKAYLERVINLLMCAKVPDKYLIALQAIKTKD